MTPKENIKAQLRTIMKSEHFHLLILEGRAGVGKTTTVCSAIAELGIEPSILGAYSTPLGFFNFLECNSSKLVIVDDCAGILSSQIAMALLKSATWDQPNRGRVVRWTSTTDRAATDEFVFTGKLVIICNSFPRGADAEAVKNRSLDLKIEPTLEETRDFLKSAAGDSIRFPDQKVASLVLQNLLAELTEETLATISYRNLQKAYEIAVHNPESWEKLAIKGNPLSLATTESPYNAIKTLSASNLKVGDQVKEFERRTGFKRRSFFKYRKQLGL